jgi:hypothetical protein
VEWRETLCLVGWITIVTIVVMATALYLARREES